MDIVFAGGRYSTQLRRLMKSAPYAEQARQKQMISLATDCAEDLMRSGKAPSQIIVHYLKLGTKQAELEIKRAEKDLALIDAKTKSIQSSEQAEELYKNALDAFRGYSGQDIQTESDEYEWDD